MDTRLLNKRVLESLVRAGALDGLGAHRAQMIAVIDRAMERAQKLQRAKESGQHGLFGGGSRSAARMRRRKCCRMCEEWPEHELLAAEYATLGFYISGHPLDKYAGRLAGTERDRALHDGRPPQRRRDRRRGHHRSGAAMRSRRGARWAILTLQDRTGVIEALVFPEAFQSLEADSEAGDAVAGERPRCRGRCRNAR